MTSVERLVALFAGLNADEQEIVVREAEDIAEGLRRGLAVYGHWDADTDERDFEREAEQEDRDRRVYTQMKRIVAERRR